MADGRQHGPLTLQWEQARFNAEVKRFLAGGLPAAADKAVRAWAFGIVSNVMKFLNGLKGLPKRIDTGRLRGAWRMAMRNAGLSTKGLPSGSSTTKAGDGAGGLSGSGGTRTATVINKVEYSAHVEHGTVRMAPGKHLEQALFTAKMEIPKDSTLPDEMAKAWGMP